MMFSADETTDVGTDTATPVSDDYGPRTAPSPAVRWVQIDIDEEAEDLDHLITRGAHSRRDGAPVNRSNPAPGRAMPAPGGVPPRAPVGGSDAGRLAA